MSVLVLLLSFVFCHLSFAQTVSQLVKAGDKKFDDGDYYSASLYYKDALRKDEENIDVNYKYAEACRLFSDLDGANYGYRTVIKLDKTNQYPLALFWLGEVLRSNCNCKCEEAQKLFHRFQSKYRKKDYYFAKAQQEIEACSWVRDHSAVNDTITIEHLGNDVNTPYSEFNAIHVFPDRLQYSALRDIAPDKKDEKYLARIYNQQPNPETVFMPNGSNNTLNIGNGAYSPDAKKFFFTQCEQKDKTNTRCDIYVTRYENFKWSPAEKLSDHVNMPGVSNTHPAVGYDWSGNEVLFFSSNREGGQGGMDIWYSRLDADGSYTQAINAGAIINTKGNEVTPFYDVNYRKLFFSSDWHYGFGGFDIFEAVAEINDWGTPKNLFQPVNTAQNDLYYTRALDDSRAYITSNRKGSLFIDAETCCNDIYAYNTGQKIEKRDTAVVVANSVVNPQLKDTARTVASTRLYPPDFDSLHVEVETLTRELIDPKQKGVKQKVPVQLYFHNDEPGARTLSDTTKLDYKQTYEAYSALHAEYTRQYSGSLAMHERATAKQEIDSFFEHKVDAGFYNLVAFSSQLFELLQQGNTIEITIKGYCSPLNFNQYNINLGYRRVASLRNYFFHYRDEVLLPYIASGRLVLKTESFGEETAAQNISDNRLDTRNSVYHPLAAQERRVEIVSVEVK